MPHQSRQVRRAARGLHAPRARLGYSSKWRCSGDGHDHVPRSVAFLLASLSIRRLAARRLLQNEDKKTGRGLSGFLDGVLLQRLRALVGRAPKRARQRDAPRTSALKRAFANAASWPRPASASPVLASIIASRALDAASARARLLVQLKAQPKRNLLQLPRLSLA